MPILEVFGGVVCNMKDGDEKWKWILGLFTFLWKLRKHVAYLMRWEEDLS